MADISNWDIKQLVNRLRNLKDLTELDIYKVLLDAFNEGFEAGKKQKKSR